MQVRFCVTLSGDPSSQQIANVEAFLKRTGLAQNSSVAAGLGATFLVWGDFNPAAEVNLNNAKALRALPGVSSVDVQLR